MSIAKADKKNKNSFKKVYSYIRRRPVHAYEFENEATIEIAELNFIDASSKTYEFKKTYASVPSVTVLSIEDSAGHNANVNVFVSAIDTTSCTISASDEFTGLVHAQIIFVKS